MNLLNSRITHSIVWYVLTVKSLDGSPLLYILMCCLYERHCKNAAAVRQQQQQQVCSNKSMAKGNAVLRWHQSKPTTSQRQILYCLRQTA